MRLRVRDMADYGKWRWSLGGLGIVCVACTQIPRGGVYLLNLRLEDASMVSLLLEHSRSHPALMEFERLTKRRFNDLRVSHERLPNIIQQSQSPA